MLKLQQHKQGRCLGPYNRVFFMGLIKADQTIVLPGTMAYWKGIGWLFWFRYVGRYGTTAETLSQYSPTHDLNGRNVGKRPREHLQPTRLHVCMQTTINMHKRDRWNTQVIAKPPPNSGQEAPLSSVGLNQASQTTSSPLKEENRKGDQLWTL